MPCYHPLTVYRSKDLNPSGKRSLVWNPAASAAATGIPLKIRCGQCIDCRLHKSREWAVRISHEASLYDHNSFVTLTYSDENLPSDGSLHLKHFQDFMKRLRKRFAPKKIRVFYAGEYGEKYGRPHYHACLFDCFFSDQQFWKEHNGQKYFTSPVLEKLWPEGFSTIGDLTFASAAYVARYITKKITGPWAERYYEGRKPEFANMSRRPGIARDWFKKFKGDVFPDDHVVVEGKQLPVPKAYTQWAEFSPEELAVLQHRRHVNALKHAYDSSHQRRLVREEVHEAKVTTLRRSYESEA